MLQKSLLIFVQFNKQFVMFAQSNYSSTAPVEPDVTSFA